MVFEIFLRCGTQAPEANCTWFRMMPGVNTGFLVPLGALAAPIDDTIGPVARLRVFRGRLSIPKVIARWFSKSSWGAGLRLLEQIASWFRMMPGVNAGFLVPLGALAAPIDDTIGPVARLRVFRGRLSIPKVIARWFSKSSWGAGLRLLEQIAHDFAWCQESTLAS